MKKTMHYYVIGGQYASYCYGAAPTLAGAKRLASRNPEYWDNWQGWHYPVIYRADDVMPVNNFYGDGYAPKFDADPVCCKDANTGRWYDYVSDVL